MKPRSLPAIFSVVACALSPSLAAAQAPPPPAADVDADAAESADANRRRVIVGGVLGGVGLAVGATAGGMTHYAFDPPCDTSKDVLECEPPDAGSLVSRRVAIGVAGWAAIAGPILGGLGGGRLTRGLAGEVSDTHRPKLRKGALGVGWGLVGLGLVQTAAGAAMFSVGLGGATEDVTPTDGSEEQDAVQRKEIRDRLKDVKVARSGVAMFMAAPTLIATGAAILFRTKRHLKPRNTQMSFAMTPTFAGLSLTGRF